MNYKEIKNRTEIINSIIEKSLTKKLNNIEEIESESKDLTEKESEKDNNWLRNNYEITLLYGVFPIDLISICLLIRFW